MLYPAYLILVFHHDDADDIQYLFFDKRIVKGDIFNTRKVFKYAYPTTYYIAIGIWTSLFIKILVK